MRNQIATYTMGSILSALLLSFLVGAKILINSSLFHYFAFTFAALLLLVSLVGVSKVRLYFNTTILYMAVWVLYIVIHTLTIGANEWYQGGSYVAGFIYVLSLVNGLKNHAITPKLLFVLFAAFGVVQALYCLLQYLHFCAPTTPLFPVSGSFENPNITAMYIAAVFPLVLFHAGKRVVLWGCVGLMCVALLVLKCRTAYLGLLPVLFIYLIYHTSAISRVRRLPKVSKGVLLLSLLLVFAAGSLYLYHAKKASADGRLFIWKITAQMIADKPVIGYGYGLSARYYNLYQAKYFQENRGSDGERKNARHVHTSYNEYLEQTAKGGIVGGVFFLGFLILIAMRAYRIKDWISLATLAALAAMGLSNFVQTAIPVWVLLLTVAALVLSAEKSVPPGWYLKTGLSRSLCMAAFLLVVCQSSVFVAQRELKRCVSADSQLTSACNCLGQYVDAAGSSEIYLRLYAKSLMQQEI